MLKKRTFRALMAYLNPIGPIGANIDMWVNNIEYFPENWVTERTHRFTIIDIFKKFFHSILTNYGEELYNRTDKHEPAYWVDFNVYPKKREIVIIPKYFTYTESKDNRKFDWRQLRDYYSLSKFMEDMELEELIIDYSAHENNFDCTITYNNKELNRQDTRFFAYDVIMMISEVLETDSWDEDAGGNGVLKLYNQNNNGYLYHVWVERNTTKGEPIILKEENFE
jgi:hypothetical protein